MIRRSSILLKRLARQNQRGYREVIGLVGTHHGVGVTYMGLMLAFYLGEELGKKTAYLEYNRQQDLSLIQRAYEWSNEEEDSFSYHQITCYREVKPNRIADILGEDYECIIIDFGVDLAGSRAEFIRCTRKLVITGHSEWDLLKLREFTQAAQAIQGNETWMYLIPQAKERTIVKIKSEIKHKVFSVPMEMEPTRLSRSSKLFIKELLRY